VFPQQADVELVCYSHVSYGAYFKTDVIDGCAG